MNTVTNGATPNPQNPRTLTDADRARAERIAAAVLAAIVAQTPERPYRMGVMTTAVYYWLAPEIPILAGDIAIAKAADGILSDAITNATARLIASEATLVDPIGEAASELARFVEAHEEELLETFAALYGPSLNYQLAAVEWQRIAAVRLSAGDSFSMEAMRRRVIADVLGIFGEMDAITASDPDRDE